MPSVTIPQHTETVDDGTTIVWPATLGSGLTCNPGDLILKQRGQDLSYTAADGTAVVFGATLLQTVFTGTGFNSITPPYFNGPYASIAPSAYDAEDEAYTDVEIWADVANFLDPLTQEYAVTVRSGDLQVHGAHIIPGAVGTVHLHTAHAAKGHFVGATMTVAGTGKAGSDFVLMLVGANQNDPYHFMTDDGSGDSNNSIGSFDGGYLLQAVGLDPGVWSSLAKWSTPSVIGQSGDGPAALWFNNTPAHNMIAFCVEWPGSSTSGTFGTGGSLAQSTNYSIRYCFTKSLTLKRSNGNSYTQTIETPLSTALDVTTPGNGLSTNTVTFTLPPTPTGFTGVRLYAKQGISGAADNPYRLQTLNTDFTVSGQVYTFKHLGTAGGWPSSGFSAWPSGTQLSKDPNANAILMKLGHISGTTDPNTGFYTFHGYHVGSTQSQGHHTTLATLMDAHINPLAGVSPSKLGRAGASTGNALVWNGTQWAPGSAGGSVGVSNIACGLASINGTGSTTTRFTVFPGLFNGSVATVLTATPTGGNWETLKPVSVVTGAIGNSTIVDVLTASSTTNGAAYLLSWIAIWT